MGIGESAASHARCRELAALGRGHAAFVENAREIAPALNACLV